MNLFQNFFTANEVLLSQKKVLANKGSYWAKHRAELEGDETERPAKMPFIPVTEAVKNKYEAGEVILIDKPLHWTSFDAVRKIRNALKIKKVGHAGTLDPLATGLLIICTGKFTKKINEFMAQEKEYTGSFTLGAVTPTYDRESVPTDFKPTNHITEAQIKKATEKFMGEIQQIPPIYSAIKKDGVALYELARRGVDVELKARTITIKSFEITSIAMPLVYFKVVCSTGTYIRSLAHDFGVALETGAFLSELRRTRIGEYSVENGTEIDAFLESLRS